MKQLLSFFVFLVTGFSVNATILNLNNQSNSPGEYTTPAAAIAAASSGDTIMVAGTDLTYGNFTIDKSIALIGPGWIVNGGGISKVAICGIITVSVHNVKIEGLRCAQIIAASGGTQIDFLSVKRCIIDTNIFGNSEHLSDALIEGCVFSTFNSYNLDNSSASWSFNNCTIRNNIFNGYLYNVDNSVITNNIFLGTAVLTNISSGLSVANVFQGNIAIGRNLASLPVGNTISGNLGVAAGGSLWNGSGNVNEADPMFTSYVALAVHSWTNNYALQVGSPAIGLGPGGSDCGVYDGDGVYRQDGEPSIPIVRAVSVPGGNTVPANGTFTVNITTVSHE